MIFLHCYETYKVLHRCNLEYLLISELIVNCYCANSVSFWTRRTYCQNPMCELKSLCINRRPLLKLKIVFLQFVSRRWSQQNTKFLCEIPTFFITSFPSQYNLIKSNKYISQVPPAFRHLDEIYCNSFVIYELLKMAVCACNKWSNIWLSRTLTNVPRCILLFSLYAFVRTTTPFTRYAVSVFVCNSTDGIFNTSST